MICCWFTRRLKFSSILFLSLCLRPTLEKSINNATVVHSRHEHMECVKFVAINWHASVVHCICSFKFAQVLIWFDWFPWRNSIWIWSIMEIFSDMLLIVTIGLLNIQRVLTFERVKNNNEFSFMLGWIVINTDRLEFSNWSTFDWR